MSKVFSYAGEVTSNSTITYTCLHNLYEELPNLGGALVALNRQQSLLVTISRQHATHGSKKMPRNNRQSYLWLCSSAVKEHPCLCLLKVREKTLNVWRKKTNQNSNTPPRAHLLPKAFPVQRSLSGTTHPRRQLCTQHGSSGLLPQQEALARQQAESCPIHLLCQWQGDARNAAKPTLPLPCITTPLLPSVLGSGRPEQG